MKKLSLSSLARTGHSMITINTEKCEELAKHLLKTVDFSKLPIEKRKNIPNAILEKLLFYLIVICHDTKGKYAGTVEGKKVNGWDYLFACFIREQKRKEDLFSERSMMYMIAEQLCTLLTDDFGNKPNEDVSARAEMLRNAAKDLLMLRGFPFSITPETCKKVQHFLSQIRGYEDPVCKKSNLLISYCFDYDIWKIKDPENIAPCIDYHVMRGCFRTGIVTPDPVLIQKLKTKEKISVEEDTRIRLVVLEAITLVALVSNKKPMEIGAYFWHHFRTNCRSDILVNCDSCKNVFQYEKTIFCNLRNVCLGYNDKEQNVIPETTVETTYY